MARLDPKSLSKIEAGLEEFEFRKTALSYAFLVIHSSAAARPTDKLLIREKRAVA